jgi:hypothetical protein
VSSIYVYVSQNGFLLQLFQEVLCECHLDTFCSPPLSSLDPSDGTECKANVPQLGGSASGQNGRRPTAQTVTVPRSSPAAIISPFDAHPDKQISECPCSRSERDGLTSLYVTPLPSKHCPQTDRATYRSDIPLQNNSVRPLIQGDPFKRTSDDTVVCTAPKCSPLVHTSQTAQPLTHALYCSSCPIQAPQKPSES